MAPSVPAAMSPGRSSGWPPLLSWFSVSLNSGQIVLLAGTAAALATLYFTSSWSQRPTANRNKLRRSNALRVSNEGADGTRRTESTGAQNNGRTPLRTLEDRAAAASGVPAGEWESSVSADGTATSQPESQNLLNLLYSIAEDQARREGCVHRGIVCNHCNMNPLRGVRYKCANCADYDLCEHCESQDIHNKTHVMLKIRIPIPALANPRVALLPSFYPSSLVGDAPKPTTPTSVPTRPLSYEPEEDESLQRGNDQVLALTDVGKDGVLRWDTIRELQRRTHFDQLEIEAVFEQFKALASENNNGIDRITFRHCLGPLGVHDNVLLDRIFTFYDRDHDGIINFVDLVCGLSVLCKGSVEEKIKYAFMGIDQDNDGFITRDELRRILRAYLSASVQLVRDVMQAMEEDLFETFDARADDKPVSANFNAPANWETVGRAPVLTPAEAPEEQVENATAESSSENIANHIKRKGRRRGGEEESDVVEGDEDGFARPVLDVPIARRESQSDELDQIHGIHADMLPVLHVMTESALDEYVERVFQEATTAKDGSDSNRISFETFRIFALSDSTLIGWLTTFGTVF